MFILVLDKNSILSMRSLIVLNEINIPIFCDYRDDSYAMICFDIKIIRLDRPCLGKMIRTTSQISVTQVDGSCQPKMGYTHFLIMCMLIRRFYRPYLGKTDRTTTSVQVDDPCQPKMGYHHLLTKVFSCRCRHMVDTHYAHHITHIVRIPCECNLPLV